MKHQRIISITLGLTISLVITVLLWSVLAMAGGAKVPVSDKYRGVNDTLIEFGE